MSKQEQTYAAPKPPVPPIVALETWLDQFPHPVAEIVDTVYVSTFMYEVLARTLHPAKGETSPGPLALAYRGVRLVPSEELPLWAITAVDREGLPVDLGSGHES